jgi:autophagy-related protein 9
LYTRRRNMAYPYANLYLAQFPKDKTEQVSAFVAFVSGAFAMVLFCFTLFDSELFLSFEITPGKTALFWIGIFSAIYSVARGSSPQDDQVQDPAYYLTHVNYHTRYEPASWQGRLHTDEVRVEFSKLYQPKVLIFAEEILSMIITPFLLIFRLPQCSERIVDFFREFSIVVDGLGTVCSYSMFPFKKGDNAQTRGRDDPDLREDYFKTKDDKMMKSFYGFMQDYQLPGNRRQFIPPPQFPNAFGAMSQTAQMPDQGTTTRGRSLGSANGKQGLHHRTPRHGPSAGRDEPIASIFLDPHHHPSASTFRNSPRQGLQPSRYQPNRQPYATELGPVRPASSRIEEESSIGDSWRTSRLAQDDEEEEEVQRTGNAHGGVLHLLQEFSKKQTGGGPSAVGI